MSEIRLPANNPQTNTWDEAYYWHVRETASGTLRIIKCGTDDDDKEKLYPEFTGFNSLREAFVKFFSIFPTRFIKVGDMSFSFHEELCDNTGAKFSSHRATYLHDIPIWALKWIKPDAHLIEDGKKYTGFHATMDDYRAIKRWQYPLPQKFTILGGSEHEDWFYHVHAKDAAQLEPLVLAVHMGGWPWIFEGHLEPIVNNGPGDHFAYYNVAKTERGRLMEIAEGKSKHWRSDVIREACKNKADIIDPYLAWYEANHTLPEENPQ